MYDGCCSSQHHSEFAIGLLLGCCVMASQMFLVLCAVFAGLVAGEDRQAVKDTSTAMSFFCAVNFVVFVRVCVLRSPNVCTQRKRIT
jgi:hypothetical protein